MKKIYQNKDKMKDIARKTSWLILLGSIFFGCQKQDPGDMIIFGGSIYTANSDNPTVESVVVKDGVVLFAGKKKEAMGYQGENTELVDLEGRTMTPGFIETHGHILGFGYQEMQLNLMYAANLDEVVDMVREAAEKAAPGEWILGRGWHQSKWDPQPETMVKKFPVHDRISKVSPDNPVFFRHASGHAGLANAKAMSIAGLSPLSSETQIQEVEGGEVIRDEMGNPTGVFNERAMTLITRHIPKYTEDADIQALEAAIKASLANGITSFHDAGASRSDIALFKKFRDEGKIEIRLYAMVTGFDRTLIDEWLEQGPLIDPWLTIRSIKLNCDGALGSHGAWLLEPYIDRPDHYGHETLPMEYVSEISEAALKAGFQVCSHAIGDRANREILDRYENAFNKFPEHAEDHRYRIEHAQHLYPDDIPRFGKLGVIPAMQAIHMASDRPWAILRLGERRIKDGAYVWQDLLKSGARVINGSDVPVEPIDPLASFYASVSRKTLKGTPEGGYEAEQRMTREQALISYTLDAAYGSFEEDFKGSIEPGKAADFTVFSKDIMTIPEREILETKVDMTIVDGKVRFKR